LDGLCQFCQFTFFLPETADKYQLEGTGQIKLVFSRNKATLSNYQIDEEFYEIKYP
jgi:hypothetical protein